MAPSLLRRQMPINAAFFLSPDGAAVAMNRALLLIDVQNAVLSGLGALNRRPAIAAALDTRVGRLSRLKARAIAQGAPVILVQHDGEKGHRLETGAPGWRLRPEIAALAGDIIVHKQSCDAFFETNLRAELKRLSLEHLVIGGCMSQFCIDT